MKKRILLILLIGINFGIKAQDQTINGATFKVNGKVGIGTTNPGGASTASSNLKLQVNGDLAVNSGYMLSVDHNYQSHGYLKFDSALPKARFKSYGYYGHRFDDNGGTRMVIQQGGNVGIGTTNPDGWRLAVNGNIRAKEIKVETGWSDFVFENDYKLPTLSEVEKHINEKGHLKDIPSAKEVEKNGIFLGEMDAKLLQKIEELTLYTIQQEKNLKKHNSKIEKLEKENKSLKSINSKLIEIQKRLEKLEKE